jgi:hypothetical protein
VRLPAKFCDGTRVQVKCVGGNTIEATILTQYAKREIEFIRRIQITLSEYTSEFPVKLLFAMIIKHEVSTLKKVALM